MMKMMKGIVIHAPTVIDEVVVNLLVKEPLVQSLPDEGAEVAEMDLLQDQAVERIQVRNQTWKIQMLCKNKGNKQLFLMARSNRQSKQKLSRNSYLIGMATLIPPLSTF